MPSWTDQVQAWVAIAALLFVAFGILQASKSLKSQNKSTDIATVLAIWERLDTHWMRFLAARTKGKKKFEFGQLIGYYEMACSLFRDEVFTTEAARTLHEHLYEILPLMKADLTFKELFEELKSAETTFEHIEWFCAQPPPLKPSKS